MADAVRTKSVELAVELLRGSLSGSVIDQALKIHADPLYGSEQGFLVATDLLAKQLSGLVKAVAGEIEEYIR